MASSLILAKAGIQSFIFLNDGWSQIAPARVMLPSPACVPKRAFGDRSLLNIKRAIALAGQDVDCQLFSRYSTGFPFPRE